MRDVFFYHAMPPGHVRDKIYRWPLGEKNRGKKSQVLILAPRAHPPRPLPHPPRPDPQLQFSHVHLIWSKIMFLRAIPTLNIGILIMSDRGSRIGSTIQDERSRIKDLGSKIGSRIKDQGSRIGSRIKDQGSRIKDRIKDHRSRIGSRIKDQGSRIGSRIKDKDQG